MASGAASAGRGEAYDSLRKLGILLQQPCKDIPNGIAIALNKTQERIQRRASVMVLLMSGPFVTVLLFDTTELIITSERHALGLATFGAYY